MIDVKRQRINGRRKMTVLAPVTGTLPDLPDDIPVHE
jgi:hypothetical protein